MKFLISLIYKVLNMPYRKFLTSIMWNVIISPIHKVPITRLIWSSLQVPYEISHKSHTKFLTCLIGSTLQVQKEYSYKSCKKWSCAAAEEAVASQGAEAESKAGEASVIPGRIVLSKVITGTWTRRIPS